MKRKGTDHRASLLLIGALAAIAGIAWGAGVRPRADRTSALAIPQASSTPASSLSPTLLHEIATSNAATRPAVLSSATLAATTPPVAAKPATTIAPAHVAGEAGMRIFRDPETGEIGPPTASQAAALESEANSEDFSDLQQVQLPDGSVMIDLKGRFQESMVVQLDAKGQRVVSCVKDPKKAFAQTPVATSSTPQREEQ